MNALVQGAEQGSNTGPTDPPRLVPGRLSRGSWARVSQGWWAVVGQGD